MPKAISRTCCRIINSISLSDPSYVRDEIIVDGGDDPNYNQWFGSDHFGYAVSHDLQNVQLDFQYTGDTQLWSAPIDPYAGGGPHETGVEHNYTGAP